MATLKSLILVFSMLGYFLWDTPIEKTSGSPKESKEADIGLNLKQKS